MQDIEFIEDNDLHIKTQRVLGNSQKPGMIRFLLCTGIVKNEKQAIITLISLIAIMLLSTILITNILLFNNKAPDKVTDKFGNVYTTEEYINLLKKGKDPLSPNFNP